MWPNRSSDYQPRGRISLRSELNLWWHVSEPPLEKTPRQSLIAYVKLQLRHYTATLNQSFKSSWLELPKYLDMGFLRIWSGGSLNYRNDIYDPCISYAISILSDLKIHFMKIFFSLNFKMRRTCRCNDTRNSCITYAIPIQDKSRIRSLDSMSLDYS